MSIYPPTGTLEIKDATLKIPVIDLQYTSNTAKIEANSNVVTEFPRSKKLIKYPRVALSTNAGNHSALGSGYTQDGYTVKVSSELNATLTGTKAFTNTNLDNADTWISDQLKYSSGTPVSVTTNVNKFGQNGEWLEIKLPNKIKLSSTRIFSRRTYVTERNDTADIWASNTGTDGDWVKLTTINFNDAYTDVIPMVADIDTLTYYQYFAIQITEVGWTNGTYVNIGEWELFGTPEYDPESHGTDVVVKSVPNVPNTDWLEVYYDGQDYSTMPVTVTDKSGKNRTGIPNGGVGFDTEYKAFTFNKTDNQYLSTSTPMNGNYVHSVSLWFKPNSLTAGSGDALFYVGATSGSSNYKCELFMESDRINYTFGGNQFQAYPTIVNGRWYHIVVTYSGVGDQSGREIYLNNVKLVAKHSGSAGNLNLTSNNLDIGRYTPDGSATTSAFDGSIANFRLFNRVLSSDEIYQLYAYQKEYFGHGDLSMTLKAGRLGIGTSEPRAALDVRGDIYGGCPVFFTAYAGDNGTVTGSSTGTVIVFNKTTVNRGGAYDISNGRCTFPVSGYYEVFFRGGTASTVDFHAKIYRNGNAPGSGGWPNNLPRLWDNGDMQYRNAGTIQFFYYFTAGEYIEVRLTNSSVFNADNYNSFSVKYLSN